MMKFVFPVLLICVVASPCICALMMPPSFNVINYGAQGNGQTDDSQAFMKAWQDACGTNQATPTLLIPEGKIFMLQPMTFQGPCKPSSIEIEVTEILAAGRQARKHEVPKGVKKYHTLSDSDGSYFKLHGTIIAPNSVEAWKWKGNSREAWIGFLGISNLVIGGGGRIDGQGAPWWKCFSSNSCDRPIALHFHACENLNLSGLTHINSPKGHISISSCNSSHVSNLHIIAPAESPNTDGIDISRSSNITIENSTVETGDDCIAINDGSTFINITGVFCGPGHGISVGSLGEDGAYATVEEIHVRNCTFNGTTNGARIKTWEGGSGYARKITFEDINLDGAKNPLIIDQQYTDDNYDASAVKVSDVTYRNVRGTSSCECVIQLNCDRNIACTNIVLESINITSATGGKIYASCQNAQGTSSSCTPSIPCLSSG